MRFFNRFKNRGFTLVELMIVVAIIGVLAALAIYGVRRYLASAKTSEAKNSIGAIARGAVGAFERESTQQDIVAEGTSGSEFSHDLCDNAQSVPGTATLVAGKKYQPQTNNADFETGNATSGWKCLKFDISSPIYYSYTYGSNSRRGTGEAGPAFGPTFTNTAPTPGFSAYAVGDLDGDGIFSGFNQVGTINTDSQALKLATEVAVVDEYE